MGLNVEVVEVEERETTLVDPPFKDALASVLTRVSTLLLPSCFTGTNDEIVLLASGFKDSFSIPTLVEMTSAGTATEDAAVETTTAPGSTALNSCMAFEQYFGRTNGS
jgi:hypothetical protein